MATFVDLISLRRLTPDDANDAPSSDSIPSTWAFESCEKPKKMGSVTNIAYGGCALAMSLNAAYQTLQSEAPQKVIYSLVAHYLGPCTTDECLRFKVSTIRETRTFSTRQVLASQKQRDGSYRDCFAATLDFIAPVGHRPDHSILTYTLPPPTKYTHHSQLVDFADVLDGRVKSGELSQDGYDLFMYVFGLWREYLTLKVVPESVLAQNSYGILKKTVTSQDHLHITEKWHADWFRSIVPLSGRPAKGDALPLPDELVHVCLIAFVLDSILSFSPLSFSHRFNSDAASSSSLDLALRFFGEKHDMNQWHLRETKTVQSDVGRSYGEAKLWSESGQLIAHMSQQCILRPHPKKDKSKL